MTGQSGAPARSRSVMDLWVLGAVVVAVGLRLLALWGIEDPSLCTRDECIFREAARDLASGKRLPTAPAGWLPAPGYPALLAWCKWAFGRVTAARELQIGLTPLLVLSVASLARRGGGEAAGRWAAWGVALHPTLVFFAITTWTETVYALLLAGVAVTTLWAREGLVARAGLAGALLGLAILTRGVATWVGPVVAWGLVMSAGGVAPGQRWRRLALWLCGLALFVGPWSLYASRTYGGPMISDATVGYVAWLGNGDHRPVTYDVGVGPVSTGVYLQQVGGRLPPCQDAGSPVARDRCLLGVAIERIGSDPATFLARVPLRLAQLFNPHTFLTRHLRWGQAPAMPWWAAELLVIFTAVTSVVVVMGSALGAWMRARGPLAVLTVGVCLYHVAVVAGLYGVSRFRLPLEPLMGVWLAVLVAQPREAWEVWQTSAGRRWGALLTLPGLGLASVWLGWTAWPGLLW